MTITELMEPKTWDNLVPGEDVVIDDVGNPLTFLGRCGLVIFLSLPHRDYLVKGAFTISEIEISRWKIKQPEPPKEEPVEEKNDFQMKTFTFPDSTTVKGVVVNGVEFAPKELKDEVKQAIDLLQEQGYKVEKL